MTIIQYAMWLALFGAMTGSVQHVAWSFATLADGNLLWGYIQAIAVDVGIAALTFGIQQRKRQRRPSWLLWAIMAVFAGISTYANLLYGLAHIADIGIGAIARWRPFVMSAVLPLMVLSLAEVVSEDLEYAAKQAAKRESQARARREQANTPARTRTGAQPKTPRQIVAAIQTVEREHGEQPVTVKADLAGISRTTWYKYSDEASANGQHAREAEGN